MRSAERAYPRLKYEKELRIVSGAHLFEESGTLEAVARLASMSEETPETYPTRI
jgi:hypothetical protein